MGIPQIIIIALYAMSLGIAWSKHGSPKSGTENAWTSVIALIINMSILYWGGFFN